MLRSLLLLSSLYLLAACTSPSINNTTSPIKRNTDQVNKVTLSHVQAYLTIGNTQKAEERFQTLDKPESIPEAMLALAELRAANGDELGAQQSFMLAISDPQLNRQQVSHELLSYLCHHKKWQTLQSYAAGLVDGELPAVVRNQQLTTIGLCFFTEQHWQEAIISLSQLDFTQQLDPFAYLALARLNIELQQNSEAHQFINKFEVTKTQVDAQTLWTSFEVYSRLQKHQLAEQAAQQLMLLFPNTAYARKYLILTKRSRNIPEVVVKTPVTLPTKQSSKATIHIIKKGETLYQLSKRYVVSVADLLKWNPTLVVDDISLGTAIQVSE